MQRMEGGRERTFNLRQFAKTRVSCLALSAPVTHGSRVPAPLHSCSLAGSLSSRQCCSRVLNLYSHPRPLTFFSFFIFGYIETINRVCQGSSLFVQSQPPPMSSQLRHAVSLALPMPMHVYAT